MFYVAKPLDVDTTPKAFSEPEDAKEYINGREHGADMCEYAIVEAMNAAEAVAKFNALPKAKKHLIPRRLTKQEIEELERRDSEAFLRDLGL